MTLICLTHSTLAQQCFLRRGASFMAAAAEKAKASSLGGQPAAGNDARSCVEWKRFLENRDWSAVSNFFANILMDPAAMRSGKFPVRDAGSNISHWSNATSEASAPVDAADANQGLNGHLHSVRRAQEAAAQVGAEKLAADPKGARSHGRKERTTFLAEIAYVGTHFSGLQRHPGQRTVVGCIEETVAPLVQSGAQAGAGPQSTREHTQRHACSLSIPGLAVSGRTDAGVSAYGQVLSLHTWNCRCVLSLHPCKHTCY